MAHACPPSSLELSTQTRALGVPNGFTARVSSIAVDDTFIYATHTLVDQDTGLAPDAGHLVIIDRATFGDPNVVPVRVPIGFDPRSVALNPNTGTIYVVNRGQPPGTDGRGPSVSVVQRAPDKGTFTELTQLKLSVGLTDVAVNPVTNRVYVSNWSQRRIHVLNGADHTELPPIMDDTGSEDQKNSFRPLGMAVDPGTSTLYVALSHQVAPRVEALAVITLANDTVQSIRRVPITPVRSQPHNVAFNPVTKRVYIANLGAAGTPAAPTSVTVLDAGTLDVIATVGTRAGVSGASTSTLAVDTHLNKIYVANAGNIQIIDGVTNQISQPVVLTRALESVALDPHTGHAYVGDRFAGEIRRVATVEVSSPIGQHLHANPQLGAPLGGPRPTPDGSGVMQSFEHATAVSTTDYGAVALHATHAALWTGADSTALFRAARPDLGNPLGDSTVVNGVPVTHFERGMIVTRVIDGLPADIAVSGPIWERYRGINDLNSFLQLPVAPEEDAPGGGWHQAFEHGHAYYRADTGAQLLNGSNFGPVHDTWLANGGPGGLLGYPLADEERVPVSPVAPQRGRMCRFEHGVVVWNADLIQTFVLTPEFERAWLAYGGPSGPLGLPVSNPAMRPVSETQARYVDFEHGVLVWFPAGHPLALPNDGCHVVTSLELFVSRFSGEDEGEDDEVDLYVRYFIDDSNGQHVEGTLPGDDDNYGTDDVNVDFRFNMADVIRGDFWVKVLLRGRDDDGFPDPDGDDTLGVIKREYSVDNLWGISEGVVEHVGKDAEEDGIFRATLVMRPHQGALDPTQFRSQRFWKFDNFETPALSLDVYDRTFSDVDAGVQFHINPLKYVDEGWEALFYHLYKGAAKPGNCFGMCLEAIYADRQRSAFAEPIFQHGHPMTNTGDDELEGDPDPVLDKILIDEINIKHGYQVGAPAVRWYPTQIIPGTVNDGREVFRRSKEAYDRGDWPVLAMVRSWSKSGHVVLPFKWVELADQWEMWVADPSKPPVPPADNPSAPPETNDDMWKIRINPQDGSWAFRGSYNSATPRWLFYLPFSLFAQQPRTPSYEALAAAAVAFGLSGTVLMLLGDADTHQISDASGRTLYTLGLGRAPETPLDLRSDADGFIPQLSRVPLLGAEDGPVDGELHLALGEHLALSNHVVGRSGGIYHWGMRTPATAVVVSAPGSTVPDRINAENLGTTQRAVSFQLPGNATEKQITLLVEGQPGTSRNKQFLLSELPVLKQQRIKARIDNGGQELIVTNNGPATTFNLQLRARPGEARTPHKQITLAGGKTARLRPADWEQPASAPLLVEVRNAPDGPPEECLEV